MTEETTTPTPEKLSYWQIPRVSRVHDVLSVVVTGMLRWKDLTPAAQDFLDHAWSTAKTMHATDSEKLRAYLPSLAGQLGHTVEDLAQVKGYLEVPLWWRMLEEAARQPSWMHSHDWHAARIIHEELRAKHGKLPAWDEINEDCQGILLTAYTQAASRWERLPMPELLDHLRELIPMLYTEPTEARHLDQLRSTYLAEDGDYLWVDFATRAREIEDQYRC